MFVYSHLFSLRFSDCFFNPPWHYAKKTEHLTDPFRTITNTSCTV